MDSSPLATTAAATPSTPSPAAAASASAIASARTRRRWPVFVVPVVVAALIGAANVLLVGQTVRAQSRAGEYDLRGRFRWYLDPSTLVVELAKVEDTNPVSLFGGLSDVAVALEARGRTFSRVELAAGTTTVFVLDQEGMQWLASGLGGLGLMQGIASHLRLPSGEPAFGPNAASYGFWGSAPDDVRDARTAARAWVRGEFPPPPEP